MRTIAAKSLAEVIGRTRPAADGFVRKNVTKPEWTALAAGCAEGRHDLFALWSEAGRMRMALNECDAGRRAIVSVPCVRGAYPSVGRLHAPAIRLERAMRDLYGVKAEGLPDQRAWLDHGRWPKRPDGRKAKAPGPYAFLPAEGEGLHQIPVGPVHAGIIEPGHFRFTANGEAVVRLEERLGYVHKGIEALCAGLSPDKAARIVSRISGDSTVAYGFAFARAVEAALGIEVPARAQVLRGIMAEIERFAHHLNDFGAICNDASAVAIHARCALWREKLLQAAAQAFGHRLMMDCVVPGGVAVDLGEEAHLREALDAAEKRLSHVVRVYDGSPSILDRTVSTGILSAELVHRYAAGGFVGRASGRDFDCRRDLSYPPYDMVDFKVVVRTGGDVNARAWVRIEEARESIAIVRKLLDRLPQGPLKANVPANRAGEGTAVAEAFRGDVFVVVSIGKDGRIAHVHARDASWFQWPLLEAVIEGNIVADFPLCNKSFNCSYSGHDI